MKIVKKIKLDFAIAGSPVVVWAKQGDRDSREIEITPLAKGLYYSIPEGVVARFSCKKPDGHKIYNTLPTIENNTIYVPLTEQTLSAAGEAFCEISLYRGDAILSTQNFILKIEESALTDAEIESSDEFTVLEDALRKVEEVSDVFNVTEDDDGMILRVKGGKLLLDDSVSKMEQQIADILYKEITIASFSNNIGTVEIGSTVDDVTLTWAFSKNPDSVTLDGEAQTAAINGKKELSSIGLTSGKTWTLTAKDERGAIASKTTSVTFLNGVYYGKSSETETIDSALVLSLTRELRSNKKPSFSVNAGNGEYIYYCLPVRFGKCSFTMGGFSGGFSLVETIDFTNASDYTEKYYVYRSDYAALGASSVTVG